MAMTMSMSTSAAGWLCHPSIQRRGLPEAVKVKRDRSHRRVIATVFVAVDLKQLYLKPIKV